MSPEEFATYMHEAARIADVGSMEEPLRACLPAVTDGYEENFLRAEGPDGVPWPKRKDKKPHPLLILHGHLIEAARDTGNPGNIHDIEDQGRTLKTGVSGDVVKYARAHQKGVPERNLPQRKFIYVRDDVVDACAEIVADKAMETIFGS